MLLSCSVNLNVDLFENNYGAIFRRTEQRCNATLKEMKSFHLNCNGVKKIVLGSKKKVGKVFDMRMLHSADQINSV